MKLKQGQVWLLGDEFVRIVVLERLAVEYKVMKDLVTRVGTRHRVTKKAFCNLVKKGTLVPEPSNPPAFPVDG